MKVILNLSADQLSQFTELLESCVTDNEIVDELMGQLLNQPEPSSTNGDLSRYIEDMLLNTTMSYKDIVALTLETYPHANTSTKSVASMACVMRKKGINVPLRLKLNLVG